MDLPAHKLLEKSALAHLTLENVHKSFGDTKVIHGVDLEVEDGEFTVFVGPSGCGKSTLLRMIAGLETVTSGSLSIDHVDVTSSDPSDRGVAMVFQSYALYPHMSVYDNMAFALRMNRVESAEVDRRVRQAADILGLDELLTRKPKALSGGQRQRVAIGRSIVRKPKIFLFDEPLSNLDAELRVQMRLEIAKLHRDLGATMIYVTHDQVEAMTLADRIVVLQGGHIEQVGSPRELYENPRNLFVAQFIGSPKMNLLQGETHDGQFQIESADLVAAPMGTRTMGARPENLTMGEPGASSFEGTVEVVEYLGADLFVFVKTSCGLINIRCNGQQSYTPGDKVSIHFDAGHCHYFDADGERL